MPHLSLPIRYDSGRWKWKKRDHHTLTHASRRLQLRAREENGAKRSIVRKHAVGRTISTLAA
jgi:hypothetical protein